MRAHMTNPTLVLPVGMKGIGALFRTVHQGRRKSAGRRTGPTGT